MATTRLTEQEHTNYLFDCALALAGDMFTPKKKESPAVSTLEAHFEIMRSFLIEHWESVSIREKLQRLVTIVMAEKNTTPIVDMHWRFRWTAAVLRTHSTRARRTLGNWASLDYQTLHTALSAIDPNLFHECLSKENTNLTKVWSAPSTDCTLVNLLEAELLKLKGDNLC